ncbi:glycosyltransferase [Macrococcus armenti]|uniref:Glycosyltransferase n=1 Tax=Macrococcus armenti TaxID=2875764 RepID=A0ABY3ZWC2_9STAP|nr:glycosyltransferase [Macrococcus armenti]UOB21216.1 glycosyltransferase [Macrococcus armenti]
MKFNSDNNYHDLILKNILKQDIDNETMQLEITNSEKLPYQAEREKINKYKDYIDMFNHDFKLAMNLFAKEKDSGQFVDYLEQFNKKGKKDFMDPIAPFLDKLPNSNGSRIFNKIDLNVGIVADEFLYNSYKDVINLHYIPYDYTNIDLNFDFVIIATTWNGIDGSWQKVASSNSEERQHLYQLIETLKKNGTPVVFYSKEDPVNFNVFKEIAKYCDYIYTSAVESKQDYIDYTGNDKVNVIQFGINPHYHNPVGTRSKLSRKYKDEVIFAGSWLQKYPTRNKEIARMFDAIIENDTELTIFDRNLHINRERYHFPVKYIQNITYPLPHEQLQKIHKVFRWAINVNSVKYSETMFANRVFELQAFGNILLSNYSTGVNNQFPNVFILNTKKDFAQIFNQLSEREINKIQAKGIRNVMRSETTYHRMEQMINEIGIKHETSINFEPMIYVVVDEITQEIQKQFDHQSYMNKQLITKSSFDEMNVQSGFVTYFKDAYFYEEYYLEDLLSAFKYTDVDFVTKSMDINEHHAYTTKQNEGLTMFDVQTMNESNLKGYALDMSEILQNEVNMTAEKRLSVIIPIHNNGIYLEDKCMASLKRSSIYDNMEIIFVNDGSTDPLTIQIINRLRRQNPSIVYYEFEAGSGSASRPRNKGAELASTPYITYLDPDNEATGDGYRILLERMQENPDIDMAIGNIIKEDNSRRSVFNYYATAKKFNNDEALITDTHQFMKQSGLRAQSIQALLIKSEIIKDNNIKMIEGAAGQDTMFFQELMLNSRNALVVNEFIHMYYAAVNGSVTNTISKKFFDKYYKLEVERIPFLKRHGLLDSYMENRFNFYIRGWYLIRLDRIKQEDRHDAITRFLDIYHLYDGIKRPENKDLELMIDQLSKEVNYRK